LSKNLHETKIPVFLAIQQRAGKPTEGGETHRGRGNPQRAGKPRPYRLYDLLTGSHKECIPL
jgi:hypothetical protein